jgi:hypothetical protein
MSHRTGGSKGTGQDRYMRSRKELQSGIKLKLGWVDGAIQLWKSAGGDKIVHLRGVPKVLLRLLDSTLG